MIINSLASIANGDTLVTRTGGDSWIPVILPGVFRPTSGDKTLYFIAEVDSDAGDWLHLNRPYSGVSLVNQPVEIVMDYTPERELPIANIGDVNMADIFNRAMILLDQIKSPVPLHGPTHVGLGTDPVPLASSTDSGLCPQLSGYGTDYLGGDGLMHQMSGVPTGCILPFAGPVANVPLGFLACDGRAVLRSSYGNLYATIGGYYGNGDGVTTFNLPDCRGRVLMGAGAGGGLTNRNLGEYLGEENHVLSVNELAAHAHPYQDNGHQHVFPNPFGLQVSGGPGGGDWVSFGVSTTGMSGVGITIQNTGANWGHNNVQPSLAVNAIIRV